MGFGREKKPLGNLDKKNTTYKGNKIRCPTDFVSNLLCQKEME